jgi:hypothetical protein
MKELGVRKNQEKFQAIIRELEQKHEEFNTLSFEDVFSLILYNKPVPDANGKDTGK